MVGSCSENDFRIENAFLFCRNNDTCSLLCRCDYLFPDGNIQANYTCKNGTWDPVISYCKYTSGIERRTCKFLEKKPSVRIGYTVSPEKCRLLRQTEGTEDLLKPVSSLDADSLRKTFCMNIRISDQDKNKMKMLISKLHVLYYNGVAIVP